MIDRFLTHFAVLLFLPGLLSAAQPAGAPVEVATLYRTAFHRLDLLDPAEQQLLDNARSALIDESVADFLLNQRPTIDLLYRATDVEICDWNLPLEEVFDLDLSHIDGARRLTQLGTLQARSLADQGRATDSADAWVRLLVFARHVANDGTLLGAFTGMGIRAAAIDGITPLLPQLDSATAGQLAARLDALPSAPSISDLLRRGGRLRADYYARLAREGAPAERIIQRILHLYFDKPDGRSKVRALETLWNDQDRRDAAIRDLIEVYDAVADALEAEGASFVDAARGVDARIAANPITACFLAEVAALRKIQQHDADRWAAFRESLDSLTQPATRGYNR